MANRNKIDQWSKLYWFYTLFVKLCYNYYYSKIQIVNKKKLDLKSPILLAPNHQNALMDALGLIFGFNKQIVFLARADIFKKPIIIRILTFLKILPAYRSRDGRENLQKNDEIFELTEKILHNKINPLCIFPEGNHGNKRRLRQLVKGMFRIAFQAQEKYGKNKGVKIIPVGIDYGHYQKFRNTQLIIAGDPIEICDFWEEYLENQPVAINNLRDKLSEELKKIIIHIETEEYYDLYMGLRKIYSKKMCCKMGLKTNKLYNQFLADKKMIDLLNSALIKEPQSIENLNQHFIEYTGLKEKLNYRDWVPAKHRYSISLTIAGLLASIILLPFAILGLFNNWPHFLIPPYKFRNLKDRQFLSTAKWASGLFIFFIYFIILAILALIFIPFWWIKILYIATILPSGLIAIFYRKFIIKSFSRIRYTFQIFRKTKDTVRFEELYQEIIKSADRIIESYS